MRDKEFWENPDRAIFISDEIHSELVQRLSPEIVKLRLRSRDPITLYIDDCRGGSTHYADKILKLCKLPTQEGQVCHVITVAVGWAASAAADLLAMGDYAIAYPTARIYYHGTRQTSEELTLETVLSLASNLRETNEQFAIRLAAKMFRRFVFLILELETDLLSQASLTPQQATGNVTKFLQQLREKLPQQTALLDKATERQAKIVELIKYVQSVQKGKEGGKDIQNQVTLLKAIIDFEVQKRSLQSIKLSDLHTIEDDFFQLTDFFQGRYRLNLRTIVFEHGQMFLSEEDAAALAKIPKDNGPERKKFLLAKVGPVLNPLWFVTVSICRSLQEGEYPLSPTDAFWLGLVDEVLGSDLPCMRRFALQWSEQQEQAAKEQAAKTAKAEPEPPKSNAPTEGAATGQ